MANQKTHKPLFHIVIRGRGAVENPTGRFERLNTGSDAETFNALYEAGVEDEERQVKTQVFKDTSKTIISTNSSPDVYMDATVNPYRGCEHGCIYCYARPGHEYLGLSAGLDFETKIFAKPDGASLLKSKLSSPSWEPKTVTFSGVTDCYQPIEKKLEITRGCMQVMRDFRNPVAIITKNHLVTRDIDIFKDMAAYDCICVMISVTTLDSSVSRKMEPRASQPAMRLKAIESLANAGVSVGIMIGPVVPGLTDHEIPAILKAVADAGAQTASYTMVRLPFGVKDLFQTWAHENYPDRADRILNKIRDMRDGKLNDPEFGTRMRGTGVHADQIAALFSMYRKKYNLTRRIRLTTEHFRRHAFDKQLSLFD